MSPLQTNEPVAGILPRIASEAPLLAKWRRYLHQHPELGYEEYQTAEFVEKELQTLGLRTERFAGTGIVASLTKGNSSQSIALRAEMDALPISEAGDHDWRSQHDGKMHACGHDGHTVTLLGAVRYLVRHGSFDGTVHFFFQPAEEGLAGARKMIEAGLLEAYPCDMIFGQHNDPLLPEGVMSVVHGPTMAASDRFEIIVKGKSGHAARPHHTIDPIVTGARIVDVLQTIPARRIDPLASAVISVTRFNAGTTGNVIPDQATLFGTVRTLDPAIQDDVEALMGKAIADTAAAMGAEADFSYMRGYPALITADAPTRLGLLAAREVVGAKHVLDQRPPSMGGEDFAFFAEKVPACFARIGVTPEGGKAIPLHNSRYDFNDKMLAVGASWFSRVVEHCLGHK